MKSFNYLKTIVVLVVVIFLFAGWLFSVALSSSPQEGNGVEVYAFLASTSEVADQGELPQNAAAVLRDVAELLPYKSFNLLGREDFPLEAGEHRFQFQCRSVRFQVVLVIRGNREGSDLQYEQLRLSRLNGEDWEKLWQMTPEFHESEPFVVGTSRIGLQEEAVIIILVKPRPAVGGEPIG